MNVKCQETVLYALLLAASASFIGCGTQPVSSTHYVERVVYALADSTLAFAVNAKGRKSVSVTSTIQHLAPVHIGEVLTARAIPRKDGGKIVHVDVEVSNQSGAHVAWLTATGYKRSETWGDQSV